jgi:putative efflux protein, MATE family
MDEKRIKILSMAPVGKAIFSMSIPVVLGMMIQVLYNLVDIYFVGKLEDPNQLAAVNIATPLFMIMMAVSGIIGTGASSYISRCLGRSDFDKAGKVLSTGIAICFCLGILTTLLGCIFINPIVKALGSNSMTAPFVLGYSMILFLGATVIMCNFALGQLLRSEGSVIASMLGMLIGTIANVILDPIFIFNFRMGVKGAAIATVLGNLLGLLYYIVFYMRGKSLVKFRLNNILPTYDILKQTFSIGAPASISQFLMGVALMLCNVLASEYGVNTVAGMGIALKIMTVGTFIFMGFAAGCQPLIGYNFGAGNYERVQEVIKKGMLITSLIGITLLILFGIFSRELISLFTSLPDVIQMGCFVLRGVMWSLPVYGAQMVGAVTVQAMGKGKASLLLSVARQGAFYIPALFLLNAIFGLNGLIFSQPVADLLALALSIVVLYNILKKNKLQIKVAL